jgi:hypothetical protein
LVEHPDPNREENAILKDGTTNPGVQPVLKISGTLMPISIIYNLRLMKPMDGFLKGMK